MKPSRRSKDLRGTSVKPSDEDRPELSRDEELCDKSEFQETLVKLYREIEQGFDSQSNRADAIADYWDCYNTKLNHCQFYTGNSQIYVPIIYDAVNARVTRFSNQIFPQSGRYVDVVTEDGNVPNATISLLEFYIRKCKMQTDIVPMLMRSGDVEGQYTVYVDWKKTEKEVVMRVPRAPQIDPQIVDPLETVDDIEEQTIVEGYPTVEVISDVDILILPATASSIEDALDQGGSVTVIRRWSKAKLRQMIADKHIDKKRGEELLKEMSQPKKFGRKDTNKDMIDAAGIKSDGSGIKCAQIYETWTKLTTDKKSRLHRIFFAGVDKTIGCKRNPFWSDNIPIISCSVEKVKGSFKGKSKIAPVATFQYAANDAVNEGMDSAAYALLPIIMTDPMKEPKIGSLVLSLAAIWETSPNDTQFAKFPEMWRDAFEIVGAARAQIFQTLSVNPAQITQTTTTKKKPSQAEIANEQQIDVLTTAGAVTTIEGGVLTPILHRMLELDHQFRNKEITIMQHGEMGVKAEMQKVPTVQLNVKHYIKWFGVEAARNAQQLQQQIAAANVLRGIPPNLYPGYQLDLVPIITQLVENTFGPRIAPLVFKNIRDQISTDPELENDLLMQGMELEPSPGDDIQKHMQAHQKAMQATGDPYGTIRTHLRKHQIMAMMQMAQQGQQQPGLPGAPGGAGPGLPGTPRAGAQPGAPRTQGPPGMIHADQMSDPARMPQ
jgi:hypothetical protein